MRILSDLRRGVVRCASLALLCCLTAVPLAHADCTISGPTSIDVNQSFTLCAPSGQGLDWEWRGSGISTTVRARCISIGGRTAGSYTYTLIGRSDGREIERCSHTVVVGSGGGTGTLQCDITGPAYLPANGRTQLCAPSSSLHRYEWTTPNGEQLTGRCINAYEVGTYSLVIRNTLTGSVRECTHYLGGSGSVEGACTITGPATVIRGRNAQLCGPSRTNVTYAWTGPGSVAAATRCIWAAVPGTYTLTIRDRTSGASEVCSHRLAYASDDDYDGDGVDDADEVVGDNCPRGLGFWQGQCTPGQRVGNPNDLTDDALRRLAACMDSRSTHFAWSNDVDGLCRALRPARPLTRRAQLTRDYAVLLANLCAAEMGLTDRRGVRIGIDADTGVDITGLNTVGELAARVERMLVNGRGNFANTSRAVSRVYNGQGIGTVCD